VYMAVYTAVHDVYAPCTPSCNGGVHSASTSVYRVHLHGRVYGPSTRPTTAVYRLYTAVHGPRTWSVRDPITAVCAARTRPCTVNTAVFTARVHVIVRTVYTAVHGVYGSCTPAVQGPCTWCVHGHVQSTPTRSGTLYTALFTACVQGRSRPCTDCVHGRALATYMVRP